MGNTFIEKGGKKRSLVAKIRWPMTVKEKRKKDEIEKETERHINK